MDSSSTSTTCLLCEDDFDVDELQELQPGFVLNWKKESIFRAVAFFQKVLRCVSYKTVECGGVLATAELNRLVMLQRDAHRPDVASPLS